MDEIVNRVSQSPLITIDLEDYLDQSEKVFLDLAPTLFQGQILREKDFRDYIKSIDLELYRGKNIAVFCSADAIIPSWAYMLIASKLSFVTNLLVFGHEEELEKGLVDQAIASLLDADFTGKKVVIKGCGSISNRDYAYFEIAKNLVPYVSSLMYGEPCSVVPVYKRK
jgi:hypothetical protein